MQGDTPAPPAHGFIGTADKTHHCGVISESERCDGCGAGWPGVMRKHTAFVALQRSQADSLKGPDTRAAPAGVISSC